ncbi:hypothetical protein JKP88DRAFT_251509 [Tribonema minus]|uniref:Uncharacterized protein n=1 Tax=Tribonema minus TaxID=303371 RepID=A0A835ZBU6_9STRA|nr:hypothetical protein JKP88DRAFT_251509 [Tribonema minus]
MDVLRRALLEDMVAGTAQHDGSKAAWRFNAHVGHVAAKQPLAFNAHGDAVTLAEYLDGFSLLQKVVVAVVLQAADQTVCRCKANALRSAAILETEEMMAAFQPLIYASRECFKRFAKSLSIASGRGGHGFPDHAEGRGRRQGGGARRERGGTRAQLAAGVGVADRSARPCLHCDLMRSAQTATHQDVVKGVACVEQLQHGLQDLALVPPPAGPPLAPLPAALGIV